MKLSFYIFLLLIINGTNLLGQNKIEEDYNIYLNTDKSSSNPRVPIILEEKDKKSEILFTLNGQKAIKDIEYFKMIDPNFSFKKINSEFKDDKVIVDLRQEKDKVILLLRDTSLKAKFNSLKKGKSQRLVLDIGNGIIIKKTRTKGSAITIPLKIYLSNSSDSLTNFTNNVETNANIAFTIGHSIEKYSFKEGRDPKLTSTYNFFGFLGMNKLELNKKNTDGLNDGDNILSFSIGMGHQFGYGKFGIGLLLGIDLPTSSIGENWVFRRKPWLGIGIGYSIF